MFSNHETSLGSKVKLAPGARPTSESDRGMAPQEVSGQITQKRSEGKAMDRSARHRTSRISTYSLLLYAICTGTLAAILGLFVAWFSRSKSPTAIWISTTAALVVCSGLAANSILRFINDKRTHR